MNFAAPSRGWHAALPCFAQMWLLILLTLSPTPCPALAEAPLAGSPPPVQVQEFLTSGDRTAMLQQRTFRAEVQPSGRDKAASQPTDVPTLVVDPAERRQAVRGFGYTLTQGSAELLQQMSPEARHSLLEELYGDGPGALHLSELRLSIGSTDLSRELYTLDDIPWWQTDPEMRHFSMDRDRQAVLPIVHEILAIRAGIHVSAAPWTAPLWMKEPLPGNRFGLRHSIEFVRSMVQAVLPLLAFVALAALGVALPRRRSRPVKAFGVAAAAIALSVALVWRYRPLHGASPFAHSMEPGGGHVAGLTASTLADSAMWPRGRAYPGYWPDFARMFWRDYEDSCVRAWSGLRTMVTNGRDWTGGQLRREDYAAYALYLTRYLQAMQADGVSVENLTVQNESEPNMNRPSMGWNSEQQKIFVRDYLGPALQRAGVAVGITAYDHNVDHIAFPLRMLSDPATNRLLTGSSFHLYEGDISSLSVVHERFPDKGIFFTEQMVIEDTRRGVPWPTAEPVERIFVGALRNWSRTVLLWNLASDAEAGPHVLGGGCPACLGAVTIAGDTVTRNLGYIAMAQVARFVPEGSVVVASSDTGPALGNVAVRTPDGHMVLVVANMGTTKDVAVECGAVRFRVHLNSGSVATFLWQWLSGSASQRVGGLVAAE